MLIGTTLCTAPFIKVFVVVSFTFHHDILLARRLYSKALTFSAWEHTEGRFGTFSGDYEFSRTPSLRLGVLEHCHFVSLRTRRSPTIDNARALNEATVLRLVIGFPHNRNSCEACTSRSCSRNEASRTFAQRMGVYRCCWKITTIQNVVYTKARITATNTTK